DANAQASGSLRFSSGSVQVIDPNNDNQPVSYTMMSNVGCGAGQVTPAGAPYAGFNVTNCGPDRLGSTFQLLDGTASQNSNVTANFVAPSEIDAASDVVDLKGTDGDLQVVQMSYDPAAMAALGPVEYWTLADLALGRVRWENAASDNHGGPPPFYVGPRAYNAGTDFHLGYYGINLANHQVWAVINHNSLFAAAIPFDLVSVVSRKTHGSAGTFDVNLPLSGAPGVECRNSGGNHTLVFTFKSNLASAGDVAVTAGAGSVAGAPTISANTLTVNLTGVANAQVTTVSLHNTTDVANQVLDDTSVNVGFLLGDVNGDGSVNGADAIQARSRSGQAVSATSFRTDVNADGLINGGDAIVVRSRAGSALP
ncbi:MAG: dockerin type I domain-containing protein, partial [Verrucomicrobiota bacterium]|nr:dockerin type I domain-containing protein [Verrucomicrobiota bacterium]